MKRSVFYLFFYRKINEKGLKTLRFNDKDKIKDSCDCECDPHLLRSLLHFKNTTNREFTRSLHVYGLEERKRNKVDREFVFREICGAGLYVKLPSESLLRLMKISSFSSAQGACH
ncbi:hypothetical protein DVH24_005218 [Malus domestica]|uniref:Uncharacterized protein n=1 Tax=Malus domestica TaxID=3750 RepID=A0A498IGP5_MALDO|nr:hypothetical protein DVH24_005218 [Malus domestica]